MGQAAKRKLERAAEQRKGELANFMSNFDSVKTLPLAKFEADFIRDNTLAARQTHGVFRRHKRRVCMLWLASFDDFKVKFADGLPAPLRFSR